MLTTLSLLVIVPFPLYHLNPSCTNNFKLKILAAYDTFSTSKLLDPRQVFIFVKESMLLTSWLIQVPWLANLSNCPLNRTSSSARLLEFPYQIPAPIVISLDVFYISPSPDQIFVIPSKSLASIWTHPRLHISQQLTESFVTSSMHLIKAFYCLLLHRFNSEPSVTLIGLHVL